jgi:hypothetical protein
MLKKLRKSSGTVTLVLIGVAALAGCSDERRDVYASKEDCLADWGNKAEDCTPATDTKNANRGFYYGPLYAAGGFLAGSNWGGSNRSFAGSRSIGSTSTQSTSSGSTSSSSRGGFGSTGRSSSSSSGG